MGTRTKLKTVKIKRRILHIIGELKVDVRKSHLYYYNCYNSILRGFYSLNLRIFVHVCRPMNDVCIVLNQWNQITC